MLERLANVIYYGLTTIAAFLFIIGLLTLFGNEPVVFVFVLLGSLFLVALGWCARYVLTGKKDIYPKAYKFFREFFKPDKV